MVRSEALKKAQKKYFEKIKGTEIGERVRLSMLESSKRAFNKRYAENEEFRKNKNAYEIQKYYYKTAEDMGAMKNIKNLFGSLMFYGR
jgi:predicted DsbA family dithiol-disulfide isomerase